MFCITVLGIDLTLQCPRGRQHAPQLAGPVRGHSLVPAPDTHAADEDPRHGPYDQSEVSTVVM